MLKVEKHLRKLRVWSKFNKNFIKQNKETLEEHLKPSHLDYVSLLGLIIFVETPEGHDFWWDIYYKILNKEENG